MSTPKRYLKPEVYKALAPQYVSGLLRGKARARFVYLMQQHAEINDAVIAWEQKLDGLNERLNDVEPAADMLKNIQARIDPSNVHDASKQQIQPGRLQRWLSNWWLSSGGLVASLIFASLLIWQNVQTPAQINYIAVLENTDGNAQWIATSSKETRKLKLDRLGDVLKSEESFVLWAISKEDGSYYRFAEVTDQEQRWIALNDEAWLKIKTAHSLIMTVETNSKVAEPTGIIVAKGLCVQLNYENKKPA
ncbi:MAG: anti-sigma-K factor RskA [Oleiphilaceae bacterium]|jgi:anti-sigma-K factor RskA